MLIRIAVLMSIFGVFGCINQKNLKSEDVIWQVDELLSVATAGYVELEGQPEKSEMGGVFFDGDGDRIVVKDSPLSGAAEFTIEMKIFPRAVFPNNSEPRMLHIESEEYPNRRITLELRLNENKQWYFDGFIKSGKGGLALIDPLLVHPTERWHHVAITFKDGVFTSWVNGRPELTGEAVFQPLSEDAKVSIGARINRVHWFNGSIETIAFSRVALKPAQFKLR